MNNHTASLKNWLRLAVAATVLAFGAWAHADQHDDCLNPATTDNDGFTIELLPLEYDGDLVTFEYKVCRKDSPNDLSHWVIGGLQIDCLAEGNTLSDLVHSATLDGQPLTLEVGKDPTTGLDGFKFDTGFKVGCAIYTITFDTSVLAEGYTLGSGCVEVATKAGQNNGFGLIWGPVCELIEEEECFWIGETAWSAGTRYNVGRRGGNWATYTAYADVEKSAILYAGQTMDAGTVHFSACDQSNSVTITIMLNPGWRFALDAEGIAVEENLKIQGYAAAPSGNPSPGGFTTSKTTETGMSAIVTVPCYDFYGIHVDVQWEYCPKD